MMKILAIDGIRDNLISLQAIIRDNFPDAEVFLSQTGKEGIESAIANDPDVILLDVVMPDMNGFEVCRQIKSDKNLSDIPVVFITAVKGDKESRIKALEAGGEAFLAKPVDESELIAQINAMVKVKAANLMRRNETAYLQRIVNNRTLALEKELEERKKTETALRESETRYKTLFNQTFEGVFLHDLKGNIIDVNQIATNQTGYTRDELLKLTVFDILSQSDETINLPKNKILELWSNWQPGEQNKFEAEHRRKDGSNFPVEILSGVVNFNEQQLILALVRDITREKQAKEAIQQSEFFANAVTNATPALLYIYDLTLNKNVWSNQVHKDFFKDLTDNPSGLGFDNIIQLVHPEDFKVITTNTQNLLTDKSKNHFESEIRLKKGDNWIWMKINISVFKRDKNGNPLQLLGTLFDINDRITAEQALLESEMQQRCYLEYAPYGVFITDADGSFLEANPAACSITGYSREELITKHISNMLANESIEAGIQHFNQVKNEGYAFGEMKYQKKGGEIRWWSIAAVKISANRFLGYAIDITDRKINEAVVLESERRAKLQRANLARIATDQSFFSGDLIHSFQHITKIMAETINVKRASIWKLSDNGDVLECITLYDSGKKQHSAGMKLETKVFPSYFSAIRKESRICAHDARNDPRTQELNEIHLKKFGITSLLDAGIITDGVLYGVVCGEHTGEKRFWHNDEESFVSIIAALVSELIANNKRTEVEKALRESEINFRALFEKGPIAVAYHRMIYDEQGNPVNYHFVDANKAFIQLTGTNPVGRNVTDAFPGIENESFNWIKTYGEVAKTGKELRFQQYLTQTRKWYDCVSYQYKPDHFVAAFFDITERKNAEMALQQASENWNKTFDSIQNGVALLDLNQHVIQSNQAFKTFIRENNPGEGEYRQFVDNSGKPITNATFERMIATRKRESTEVKIKEKIFDIVVDPIFDANGEITGAVHIISDITKRRQDEELIRKNEERFQMMVKNTSDIIMVFNPDGSKRYVSPAIEKITGYSPDEVTGKFLADMIHPEDLPEVMKIWEECMLHPDKALSVQYRHRHKTKEWVFLEAIGQSFLGESPVNTIIMSVRDISEQKQKELLHRIQYNIANAVATSRNYEHLFGVVKSELNQIINTTNFFTAFYNQDTNTLRNVINIDEKDEIDEWSADGSLSGIVVKEGKSLFLPKAEINKLMEERGFDVIGAPAEYWAGVPLRIREKIIGAMVVQTYDKNFYFEEYAREVLEIIASQISLYIEKLRDEKELIEAKERAVKSDKLKTAFLNNISHEIRTPLSGILGFGSFLLDADPSEEERTHYKKIIEDSTLRLTNTINDYMDISLLTSGNMTNYPANFEVLPMVNELGEMLINMCQAKNLHAEILTNGLPANYTILADRELIKKAITHLLNNAVKFTPEGTITFSVVLESGILRFMVKDTGIGISEEAKERIFQHFGQEEITPTRNYEGSGLGLTIAKGIAELYNGKIYVESFKGKGSEFCFDFPVADTTVAEKQQTDEVQPTESVDRPLVLIAEDEESNSLFLKILLKKANCEVIHALNGQEAVEQCRLHPEIKLVFMDIKMPVLNGIEATRQIKEFRPDLYIVAITAHAITGDEHRIRQAGCDDYIAKPVKIERILDVLNKRVSRSLPPGG
ncbi:MAG TPA: PAS domain S-box protein [Bacteroidales bacterium]|nr:PAS domain S-box protein [Bacteroidales bacterium]